MFEKFGYVPDRVRERRGKGNPPFLSSSPEILSAALGRRTICSCPPLVRVMTAVVANYAFCARLADFLFRQDGPSFQLKLNTGNRPCNISNSLPRSRSEPFADGVTCLPFSMHFGRFALPAFFVTCDVFTSRADPDSVNFAKFSRPQVVPFVRTLACPAFFPSSRDDGVISFYAPVDGCGVISSFCSLPDRNCGPRHSPTARSSARTMRTFPRVPSFGAHAAAPPLKTGPAETVTNFPFRATLIPS